MTPCKQLESSYIDYVCDQLDASQKSAVDAHLRACPGCMREVLSLQQVLRLTEEAGQVTIPDVILNNIEMNVYKRLATEIPRPRRMGFVSRCFGSFSRKKIRWFWRGAIVTCVLAVGFPIGAIFLDDQPSSEVSVDVSMNAIPIQTPHERIEQYRQREIQNSRKEALEAIYLKNDDRFATIQLSLLAEQVP